MTNQALIDEIVTNVLAKLQPVAARPVEVASNSARNSVANLPVVTVTEKVDSKPVFVELNVPVITADVLETSVRAGQALRIGRSSILTPAAKDWLHSKRLTWSRLDKSAGPIGTAPSSPFRWQIILQTVTPTVRALQDGLKRLSDGWKIELVGQPSEAALMAISLINTAECDGVVIFTEHSELVTCRANRDVRVRAATMQNAKQWEQVMRTLSANVVCISPIGKTFIELRNLLRDCAGSKPRTPVGW